MSFYRCLFKDRSLWFKFFIMTVLPLVLVSVFLVLIIVRSVQTSMEQKAKTAAEALIRLTGLSMSNASVIYNKDLLDNFVDSLAQYQDIPSAAVVDAGDGRILAHSQHQYDGRLYDGAEAIMAATSTRRSTSARDVEILVQPIVIEDHKYGELIIGYSRAGVRRDSNAFKGEVAAIAGMGVILGVLMAVGVARFISRPIKDMASQAQKIGAGELLETIAYDGRDALGQLASAFDEMASTLQDRRVELTTINSIAEKLHQSLDWGTVINQAVDILAEYSGSPSVAVFTWDRCSEVLRLAHHRGFNDETIRTSSVLPLEGTLTGLAVKQRSLIVSHDISRDERLATNVREALMRDGFRGGVTCLPLIFKDQIMGVVNFIYREPYTPSEAKQGTYLAIGRTIALALANAEYVARIEEEITERKHAEEALLHNVQEMSTLNILARRAGRYLSVDQVVQATIESLHSRINFDVLLIYLLEEGALVLKGVHAGDLAFKEEDLNMHPVGDCLCGLSAQEGISIFSIDIHSDPRCSRQECRNARLHSFAALPLLSGDRVIGLLGMGACEEHDYNAEAPFLETISRQVAVSLVNAMLYEQIRGQAAELEKRVAERTAELEVAMQRAQEADRIKSAFLASMSHELRTPLNSIIGFTGILLQGLAGELNGEQRKQMGMVQNSARHLLRLINDVLDISKIEAGQLEMSCERFDMAEAIGRVIQIVAPLAEKKGLAISVEIAPEVGQVDSDRRRVEQVLINLINNAIKFTDGGRIHVSCHVKDSRIVTSVIDTGIGIKREDMGTLFEAFRQINNGVARLYEGTGLGLSICRKLLAMLGGEIQAESRGAGMGSTFVFTLPSIAGGAHEA
jgi:signal transduction histidine kinase/uncharacterized membrane protein affecting hemolysin expression